MRTPRPASGSTSSPTRSRRRWSACSASRPPARTATRSPGSNYEAPDAVPLDGLAVGDHFEVSRIPEELEFAPGLLAFLEQSHLVPGSRGEVTSASPDGTRTVEVEGQHVGIGTFASTRILVTTR